MATLTKEEQALKDQEEITKILKMSDHVESEKVLRDDSETKLKFTTKTARLIPMYNVDGKRYMVPKVHFQQWLREGLTVTAPDVPEGLWFNCKICNKRLRAGAGIPDKILENAKARERAIQVAELTHIMQKHGNQAPVVLTEKEYDLAKKVASS